MSGKHRIINGEIAQGKLRGKALADALADGLVKKDEKSASYQNANIKSNDKKKTSMAV